MRRSASEECLGSAERSTPQLAVRSLLYGHVPEEGPGRGHDAFQLRRLCRQGVEVADLDTGCFVVDDLLDLGPKGRALCRIALRVEGVNDFLARRSGPPARRALGELADEGRLRQERAVRDVDVPEGRIAAPLRQGRPV